MPDDGDCPLAVPLNRAGATCGKQK